MTHEEAAAYVHAQSVACLCEMKAMEAANKARAEQGHSDAYGEESFTELPTRFGLHHNQVTELFRSCDP